MKLKIYQVDAFTDKIFSGNPAAICPLDHWLDDTILQNIAMENNLAETAFYVQTGDQYELRWFTPTVEVDLCGHATLASAYVLFFCENHQGDTIHFHSPRSGALTVTKKDNILTLNFPVDRYEPVEITDEMLQCFNYTPTSAYKGRTDYFFVFDKEEEIQNMVPVLQKIAQLDCRGVIVTARGNHVDFVSRFFGPQTGVDEDPVTGSAHTTLTPYWSQILNKSEFSAIQLSERQGHLQCKLLGDRVEISGQGRLYLVGEIYLD